MLVRAAFHLRKIYTFKKVRHSHYADQLRVRGRVGRGGDGGCFQRQHWPAILQVTGIERRAQPRRRYTGHAEHGYAL